MVQKAPLDDTARKRIADVFARLPTTDGKPASDDPVAASAGVPRNPVEASVPPVSAQPDDPALLRIVEAARRPGWRGWLIRKLAGL